MAIVASGQLTLVDLNDSKQLVAYIGASQAKTVLYNPNNNSYTPNYASTNNILTPQLYISGTSNDVANQTIATRWYVQTNGTGTPTQITASNSTYTLGTGNPVTLTIKSNVLSSNNSMRYICEMDYPDPDTGFVVTAKAEIELVKISTGSNTLMAVLTNESHTIPTNVNGNNGNYSGASTKIIIYNGTTDDTANWTITPSPASGVTGSWDNSTKTYTVTNMTVDTGYVDFTCTRSGFPTITKRFTLTKSKQGTAGQNATAYWLIAPPVIQKNDAGAYTPASITVQAMSKTGSSAPAAYAGRFIIAETTNGTSYTDKYTSSANESSKTYTPSANIKAVRVRLYLAGGTSTLLDEQIIPIVADGANSVYAMVWTPDGNIIRNASGSLTAKCDIYEGGVKVTASAYKWYIQDPTATTSSGGDADGGNGWRLLNATYNAGTSGYTTDTLTIPASAIQSVESFKCVATYDGQKYSDVCTVVDVSDPIMVTIVGTNIFKNGQGSTQLTAKLYQAGQEIDASGTMYTYTWYLYKNDGTRDMTFGDSGAKTGKTITVNATEVDVRGNIVCEVSK